MEFTLRPLKVSDAFDIASVANNFKIAKNLTNKFPHPYSLQDAENFIAFATNDTVPNVIFGIEIHGKISGAIGLHPQQDISSKNAELGYWLAEPFWGNGVISRAIPQVVTYGFENMDITRIFARPFGTNIASQRVLEKVGFKFEYRFEKTLFKNGEYLDELFYAMRK